MTSEALRRGARGTVTQLVLASPCSVDVSHGGHYGAGVVRDRDELRTMKLRPDTVAVIALSTLVVIRPAHDPPNIHYAGTKLLT